MLVRRYTLCLSVKACSTFGIETLGHLRKVHVMLQADLHGVP